MVYLIDSHPIIYVYIDTELPHDRHLHHIVHIHSTREGASRFDLCITSCTSMHY